jgi:hypothetical protein
VEAPVDIKKFLRTVLVAYVLLIATTYLIHGVWLGTFYRNYMDSWRPVEEQAAKGWILLAGRLLYTLMFVWVYTRGAEKKLWLGQGIRYGGVVWLFVSLPSILSTYVLYPVPFQLAMIWMSVDLMQAVLLGLVVAYFLRKPPAVMAKPVPTAPAKPPGAADAKKSSA